MAQVGCPDRRIDRLVIVVGVSSKWAGRRRIKPDELLGEPWTFPPAGSIPSTNIANAFQSVGLSCPRPTVPTDSISAIIHLLAAGRFLTVLPESMIRFRGKNLPLKVLPVELPARQLSVVIVTMKNRTLRCFSQTLHRQCTRHKQTVGIRQIA